MEKQQIHLVYASRGEFDEYVRYVHKVFLSLEIATEYKEMKEKEMTNYKRSDEYINYKNDESLYDPVIESKVDLVDDLNGYTIQSYDIDDYYYINRDNVINSLIEKDDLNI